MSADWLGLPVTGDDPAARAAVDAFGQGLLAYEIRAHAIVDAAAAAPGHCLANANAGLLHMMAEEPGATAKATPCLANARAAATDATARERTLVAVLEAWVADDLAGAEEQLWTIVRDVPRDLVAAKLLHYLQFNRGDFPAMLRAALPGLAAAPEVAHAHGLAAFAYEQCHLLVDAEREARAALAISERDFWAQHALAHVMLTTGRIAEGVAFLEGARDGWTGLTSFMQTHLWWHLALFYQSQGREAAALAAYDAQVWAVAKGCAQDQVGAVSLLARLEMDGLDVGERWAELGEHLAGRAEDVGQPFLTVQYLYGLARAGRPEAERLLAAVEAIAERRGEVWAELALPLARGLLAHARGAFHDAAGAVAAVLPRLRGIGGSHAQRDLFEQILLDAFERGGDLVEAQQLLEQRRAHDPDGAALNLRLARVYDRLGLPEQAAVATARAERTCAAI